MRSLQTSEIAALLMHLLRLKNLGKLQKILHLLLLYVNINASRQLYVDSYEEHPLQ